MRVLVALLLASLLGLSAAAQTPAPAIAPGTPSVADPLPPLSMGTPNSRATFTLYYENDMFTGSDRYYTDGARVSYLSPDIEDLATRYEWAHDVAAYVPFFHRPGYTNNVGFAIGQDMFTPADYSTVTPNPKDRPYAGWLYGAVSLQHKNAVNLHSLELTLGMVGPASLAGTTQRNIHRWRGINLPYGWEHQLKNEPGAMLTYLYKRRLVSWNAGGTPFGGDVIPSASATLGNVLTQAAIGTTVRVGWNVPRDFHGNRIHPSGYSPPAPDDPNPEWYRHLSIYAFAGAEGRAVAHDLMLDGNTFRDGPSVDHHRAVAEYEYGIGVRYRQVRVTFTEVIRTLEFHGQQGFQKYGALSASYSW